MNKLFVTVLLILSLNAIPLACAEQKPLETQLSEANVTLTEITGREDLVRDWLKSDPAYQALAAQILRLVGDQQFKTALPIEVINGKFKTLLGRSPGDYVDADQYGDQVLIKKATLLTWQERNPAAATTKIDEILQPRQPTAISAAGPDLISIEVDAPDEGAEIDRPQFTAKGRVLSRVPGQGPWYIYSIVHTDQYYRQDTKPLDFRGKGDQQTARWNLNLLLGRPEDVGLQGTLYLFVVNRENLKKLIAYYQSPQPQLHDPQIIPSAATRELMLERAIPVR